MRLEILVKQVAPDEGLLVDENDRQWTMVEVRHDEAKEPCWLIETKVKGKLVYGTYDDVVIHVSNWSEISRYMQP